MLFFCDESWKTGTDGRKVGTLAAIGVRQEQYNTLEDRVFVLAQKYFGFKNARDREIKGKNLLCSYEYRRVERGEVSLKLAFARELMEAMTSLGVHGFASVVYAKQEIDLLCEQADWLDRPYFFLLERIHGCVSERAPGHRASVVFDDRGLKLNGQVAQSYRNFLTRSQLGRSFDAMLRTPFFAYSQHCTGLQLADLLCTVVNRYHTERDASTQIRVLYSVARQIEWRAESETADGYILRGFKEIHPRATEEEIAS